MSAPARQREATILPIARTISTATTKMAASQRWRVKNSTARKNGLVSK
ncbi:MAG TPA: hypothetical protein VNK41_10165 [Vicinamibacterales bacterium]|nr:hypothetical protein [Vicinamibacterales bacterium]